MPAQIRTKQAPSRPSAFRPPYPPSGFDRFTQRIDRLPGPSWAWYLAFAGLIFLLETLIQWASGEYPVGTIRWLHLVLAGSVVYFPGFTHYLDRTAGAALDNMRPVLKASAVEYADLRYRLTTLPPRAVRLSVVLGVVNGVTVLTTAQTVNLVQVSVSPISWGFNVVLGTLTGFSSFLFIYHLFRQLALVSDIYTRRTHVHLFRLGPLYALSGLTARTAIGVVALSYLWIVVAPDLLRIPVSVGVALIGSALAAATFALPLLGVHRLLVEEKERWISKASRRYEDLVVRLHRALDGRGSRQVANCREGLAALEIELARLEKVPTWPWQPQTVRGVIAALLLPVAVWVVQLVLGRVLGV